MNPYPQDQSILVLDNCAIHKANVIREIVGWLLHWRRGLSSDLGGHMGLERNIRSIRRGRGDEQFH